VDVVGEVLPDAADASDLRLTAELALGTDLARHARHFGGEGVELVDHGIDRLLQLQDFALHVGSDLARQVAVGDGSGHLGNVAYLTGEVARHGVDTVGQVLPGTGDTWYDGLTTETALGTDFACDACDFRSERPQLVDHGIDRFFELQDLT